MTVHHGKMASSYTLNYYDTETKEVVKGEKYVSPIFDKCNKIYEYTLNGYFSADRRLVVRNVNTNKVILDIPEPAIMTGDVFVDEKGVEKSISKSLILSEWEGDLTYVGHQVFSFKLLEKISNASINYNVYLTPSGIIKPYIEGKKYIYSLRDKVAVPITSLHIDSKKYMNEQLKDVDSKFTNAKEKIPFPVTMIDPRME